MKKYLYWFMSMSLLLACATMAGCGEEPPIPEPETPNPVITISGVASTVESISFKLTTKDADAYAYALVGLQDFEDGKFTLKRVEGVADNAMIEVKELSADTKYRIVAVAYSQNTEGKQVTQPVQTLPVEIVAPTIDISDIVAGVNDISFKLSHTGTAVSYQWAVYEQGRAETAEYTAINEVFEDKAVEVKVENLTPETTYIIEAYAVAGNIKTEHTVSDPVTTLEDPDAGPKPVRVTISDIGQKSANITVVMDPELCSQYYIGADMSSSIYIEGLLDDIEIYEDDYLKTADINGSLCDEVFVGMWGDASLALDTEYTVWVIPCDTEGNYVKDEASIELYTFRTAGLATGSDASVKVEVLSSATATATIKFTPENGAVKYHYQAMTKAMVDNNFASDALLMKELTKSGTPTATDVKEHTYTKLNVNTDYYFCAIAVDADGVYGTPVKTLCRIPDYDFTSTVSIAPAVVDSESSFLQTVFQLNASAMSNVEDIRVVFCTAEQFQQTVYFGGDEDKVKPALAAGQYPSEVVAPGTEVESQQQNLIFNLTAEGKLTISGTGHKPNTRCRLYVMVKDKSGKFTEWSKLTPQTKNFDFTGIAKSETEIVKAEKYEGYNWTNYTLEITPNAATQEFWVGVIYTSEVSGKTPAQRAEYCLSNYRSQHFTGNEKQELELTVYSDSYLWVLCRDSDGKLNNLYTDTDAETLLENIYANSGE